MSRLKGFKHTEATKLKMSQKAMGRSRPEEVRKKISETRKAKHLHLTEEQKKNLSEKFKGRIISIETRRKMSEATKGKKNANYGKSLPLETKQKISEALSGSNNHNWKGGKIKGICETCGKEISFFPRDVKRVNHHFCSNRCASIYRMKHQKNNGTSIELAIEEQLLKSSIPYMKQVPLEGIALVDFLLPNRIVIQCDGEYWHRGIERQNRDMNQDFILGFKGYKIYRFKESEIKESASKCINKIIAQGDIT